MKSIQTWDHCVNYLRLEDSNILRVCVRIVHDSIRCLLNCHISLLPGSMGDVVIVEPVELIDRLRWVRGCMRHVWCNIVVYNAFYWLLIYL